MERAFLSHLTLILSYTFGKGCLMKVVYSIQAKIPPYGHRDVRTNLKPRLQDLTYQKQPQLLTVTSLLLIRVLTGCLSGETLRNAILGKGADVTLGIRS
jgi:hypothetical protein